jgi:hypothetical protein
MIDGTFSEVNSMGRTAVRRWVRGFPGEKCAPAHTSLREEYSVAGSRRRWIYWLLLGFLGLMLVPSAASSGVLSESDLKKVEDIKPLFQNLMADLVQTSKRPDISTADADCITSTIRELLQISEELSSYEYLITIEKEVKDFGDNSPVQGVIKFAIDKSNTILSDERKRLVQLSDRCSRSQLSFGKTQQALQFIDTTSSVLSSIQARL